MKQYHKLRIVGDEDMLLDGYLFHGETFYFRKDTESKKVIDFLERFKKRITPIDSKKRHYKNMMGCINDCINFLKKYKTLPEDHYYTGGNQCVTLEIMFCPDEEDYI